MSLDQTVCEGKKHNLKKKKKITLFYKNKNIDSERITAILRY